MRPFARKLERRGMNMRPAVRRLPTAPGAGINALPLPAVVVAPDAKLGDAHSAAQARSAGSRPPLTGHRLRELIPFGSPLLSLVEEVRARGGAVNEYRVALSTPRNPGEHLVDLYVAPLPEQDGHVVVMLQERTIA